MYFNISVKMVNRDIFNAMKLDSFKGFLPVCCHISFPKLILLKLKKVTRYLNLASKSLVCSIRTNRKTTAETS